MEKQRPGSQGQLLDGVLRDAILVVSANTTISHLLQFLFAIVSKIRLSESAIISMVVTGLNAPDVARVFKRMLRFERCLASS